MLKKYILGVAVAATAFTFSAGASSAEEFRIMVMDEAFFPEVSYISADDVLIFVNMSGQTLDITAHDESWVIPDLSDGSEGSLIVTAGMANVYSTTGINGDITGKLSFGSAPNIPVNN